MSKPDLAAYPVRMDRRGLAAFITREFFPVSPRSLERWPLTWQHVNNKAIGRTAEAAAVAASKLDEAPSIRGGKRAAELSTATWKTRPGRSAVRVLPSAQARRETA